MSELLASAAIALNLIGVIATLATYKYSREASVEFGDSAVGDASSDISFGTVFLTLFMIFNTLNSLGLEFLEAYSVELELALTGVLVGGIFFYAMAFNRLAEVLQ